MKIISNINIRIWKYTKCLIWKFLWIEVLLQIQLQTWSRIFKSEISPVFSALLISYWIITIVFSRTAS